MSRFFRIVSLMLVLSCIVPAALHGQARIHTKKLKIADLATHTTKVVLGSGDMMEGALREEVAARWRISPYEFCTVEEFNSLKDNPDYYFLLFARSDEKRYRGMLTLTLMKGGKAKADDPQKRPVDVASLPVSASSFPSGREMVFLPALLDILQDYVSRAMRSDRVGYKGFDIYSGKLRGKKVVFSEDDLVPEMDGALKAVHSDGDMVVVDEAEADKAFMEGAFNTAFSYVVAPYDPQDGSWCYKMLIDAGTHELLYFKHHRISARDWAGFLSKDIRAIRTKL